MRTRLIKSATLFYILPTISLVLDKTWYGHKEIAIAWLKWYACLEWGYEN